jgi:ADP-sugar diphosphatase
MLDGSGHFKGVAAEEIAEECNIVIGESELTDLTELAYGDSYRGIIPSSGGSDEFYRMFVFRREVEPAVLTELQGRLTGLMAEGEYIKLNIIPLGDLWKSTPDAKALCALALFDCLKRQGTLPQSAQTVGQTAVTSAAELVPTAQATAAAAADAEAEDDEHGGDDEQREAAAQSKTTERASSSLLLAGGCEDAVPPQSASSARSSQSVRAKKMKTPFWCH